MVLFNVAKRENTEKKDISEVETIYHTNKTSIEELMTNYSRQLPKIKNVSYAEYEVDRLNMMEEKLMRHLGKNYSQLHKDLVRKEFTSVCM
tara:strand:+ start:59 stop:331 length:273 start_codon:yes stop_codon:yes gene_type:complete